jgi:hypothetical protein
MAHLVAISLPVLLYVMIEARSRTRFTLGATGVALPRRRWCFARAPAWLGAGACGAFLAVEGLWVGRPWADEHLRRRVLQLAAVAVGSLLLAMVLPNRLNWRSDSPYSESLMGWPTTRKEAAGG